MGSILSLRKLFGKDIKTGKLLTEMSSKSVEDNYRRDSFEDRVCDDLSEVILQYLSLKDRLNMECVSKQFQRTIYQGRCNGIDITLRANDSSRMELLFKKCPNIQFDGYYYLYEFFELIDRQNRNNFFIAKFCPKVVSLKITNRSKPDIIECFPNVERLYVYLYQTKSGFGSEIKFKNLKKLQLFVHDSSVASFALLLDNHKNTLQFLFVFFHRKPLFDTEVDTLLAHTSNLSQLTYLGLSIKTENGFNDKKVKEVVKRLPRLKLLRLNADLQRFQVSKKHNQKQSFP